MGRMTRNPATTGRGAACHAPGAERKLFDLPRNANAGFGPKEVFPGMESPCPLGPGRGKRRPYRWG